MSGRPVLEASDLRVQFDTQDGCVEAVAGVSFSLEAGQVLGIVGESGSGKSVACLAMLGLAGSSATVRGAARFRGRNLVGLPERELCTIRGCDIAMVFQDPMTSLNPVYTVGHQIAEQLRAHLDLDRRQARARAIAMLDRVGIPDGRRRFDSFPHEFSGGMRQRAMIAMALCCEPAVLIADEPTTALDVTIQAQIIDLIAALKDDLGAAVIMISHDLGVVADIADEVAVMYSGRIVEQAAKREIFDGPQHPYTWGLLASIPRLDRPRPRRLTPIPGLPPAPVADATGCRFAPRCAHAFDRCEAEPALERRGGHRDRCWLPDAVKQASGHAAGGAPA